MKVEKEGFVWKKNTKKCQTLLFNEPVNNTVPTISRYFMEDRVDRIRRVLHETFCNFYAFLWMSFFIEAHVTSI